VPAFGLVRCNQLRNFEDGGKGLANQFILSAKINRRQPTTALLYAHKLIS
jgi:hypothetical protein